MSRQLAFDGVSNARDLGGLPTVDGRRIRPGLLIRSAHLSLATEADLAKLAAIPVRTVIDFRSEDEVARRPDPVLPNSRYVNLAPLQDVAVGITHSRKSGEGITAMIARGEDVGFDMIDEHMCDMYRCFVRDPQALGQFARFFDELLTSLETSANEYEPASAASDTSGNAPNGAILWHCVAGKDRAGFATALVLEALGVPRRDIVADYLITNKCVEAVVQKFMNLVMESAPEDRLDIARQGVRRFFRADESFLTAAFDTAVQDYGSVRAFMREALDVTDDKRALLRDLTLE